MTTKKGRPTQQEQAKTKSLHLRITESELNKINNLAKNLNINRTAVIMMGIELIEKNIQNI